MSGTLAKHRNALGWAWYLDTDEGSYWVSPPVKEHIESLEAKNDKLRELASILCYCMHDEDCDGCKLNGERGEIVADPLYACDGLHELLRELGVEA